MVQCPGCTRAFVDVRESYWMLRAAAPVLLLGAATAAQTSTVVAAAGAGVAGAGIGGGLATLGTRVVLTVRSALTDPVSLTATVAGGLFITTAVTTGVAGGAGAIPTFPETGIVSVSTPDVAKAAVRGASPASRAEDPANLPEPTRSVPPGQARGGDMPPGLAKKGGLPPGLAKDAVPPGLAKQDDVPPGLAKPDELPPGQSDSTGGQGQPDTPGTTAPDAGGGTDRTPPGLAKQDKTPPGQVKKDGTPPGQVTKDESPPGQVTKDESPPGQAKQDKTPPGQAKKDGASSGTSDPASGPPDHSRSRSTSTS
jgi:hypothetical protein